MTLLTVCLRVSEQARRTAAHAAAFCGNLEVIAALLAANPAAASEKDEDEFWPLHFAVSSNSQAAGEVVAALLAAHPEAALKQDGFFGQLPLHTAASLDSDAAVKVVAALLAANQATALEKDVNGILPLCYAAQTKGPYAYAICAMLLAAGARPELVRAACRLFSMRMRTIRVSCTGTARAAFPPFSDVFVSVPGRTRFYVARHSSRRGSA